METETIDRLFLELSQFTKAKTERELKLESDSVTRPLSQGERFMLLDGLKVLRNHERHSTLDYHDNLQKLVDLISDDKLVVKQL